MKKTLGLLLICISLLVGCQPTIPKDALTLSTESLAERQLETRKYETNDEAKILAACAALLQDMGFNLDESETKLGLITSSKMRSAVSGGEVFAAILVAALGGGSMPIDKQQKMRACVVTRHCGENGNNIAVRVTFQRVVWNTQGQVTKSESLTDPSIYKEFFSKLSKSIFLEGQEI